MSNDASDGQTLEALIDRLGMLQIDGPSRGGPHVGIQHNDVTRKILAAGKAVIPLMVARLPGASFDEAVYIVFMLRELRAVEAEGVVRQIRSELEKRSLGRDLTLKMQIEYYLRDVHSWR